MWLISNEDTFVKHRRWSGRSFSTEHCQMSIWPCLTSTFSACITCINLLSLTAIPILNVLHVFTAGHSFFMLHLIYFTVASQKNQPEVISNTSNAFHSLHAFLLLSPFHSSVPSPYLFLSFCLNLLSLMSPSRESQARKKVGAWQRLMSERSPWFAD